MEGKSIKQIVFSSLAYSLLSILGPLLILGVPAYLLDKVFETKPFALMSAVFLAFIITNVLLFKKVTEMNRQISANFPATKEVNNNLEKKEVVKKSAVSKNLKKK